MNWRCGVVWGQWQASLEGCYREKLDADGTWLDAEWATPELLTTLEREVQELRGKAALAAERRRPVYITWAGTPLKFRAECPDCHLVQPLEEHPKTSDDIEKIRREFQHGDWCWLARYDALVTSEEGTNG